MIRTCVVVFCLFAIPAVQAQFTVDVDTFNLPRAFSETWWFDDDDSGNSMIVSNINAFATPDGPLPGWAWTRMNFMVASNLNVFEAGLADVVTNVSLAGPGDIVAPGSTVVTITNDLTVGNLVTDVDFRIGNNATLTLDQGGLMFRGANHNVRNSSGLGFLTSSYSSGNGTNELFVTVTDDGTVYQIFGIEIVDDGATPVTVIVDGYDMVDEGEIRFSDENHYTGGTIVNRIQCWSANDESFGSGPVIVHNSGTVYIATSSGAYTNDFIIAGNGWEDGFFGPVGALRVTSGTRLTGNIILSDDARIGSTSSGSNPARIEGLISGPFDLETFGGGNIAIINSGHTYSNTTLSDGVLQLGEPGAPASLPSNTTVTVASGAELRGFTDFDGTVDLSGTLTPGFVHLPETMVLQEAIFRAGSTLQMDLSVEAKDFIALGDLTVEGGTIDLNIIGEFNNGTYVIMTYTNLISPPASLALLALSGDTGRRTAVLDTGTLGQIRVNVSGSTPPLSWKPPTGNLWDLDTSINWNVGLGGLKTFKTADPLVFSSAGTTSYVVNLVGALTPGVVFVVGNTNYVFTGSGRLIGNGDLNMNSSGSLTINNDNDAFGFDTYKGLITVASNGTLIVGNNDALGDISVGTVIEGGATLDLNGKNIADEPVSVAGAGVGGLGAIVNHVSAPLSYNLKDITMTDDTTFGGTFHWTLGFNNFADPGSLSTGGQPHNLVKIGPNQFSLRIVDVDPALWQIDIKEGTFGMLSGASGLGDPAGPMNIESNATFFNNDPHAPAIKQFNFKDGSEMRSQSSGNILDGEVKLTGKVLFNIDSGSLTVKAPIIGTGEIEKIDGGALIFTSASNTYSGLTHIKDGRVQLGNDTPDGNFGTGPVTIEGSVSRIVVNRSTDASILNPISGRGVIELFGTNKVEFGFVDLPGPFHGSIILFGYPGEPATLHVSTNSDIRIEELITGINFGGHGDVLQTGGSLKINDFSVPMKLGNSFGGTSVFDLVDGQFTATNGGINVGFHGDAVWNITGGTATVAKVVLNAFNSTGSGTLNLGGGVLEVEEGGLINIGVPYAALFTGGTFRAIAPNVDVAVDVTLENMPVIDTSTATVLMSQTLSGGGGMRKVGLGTLHVTGTNTFAGDLAIEAGTLDWDGQHSGAGTYAISNAATMTGAGSTDADVDVATGGTLAPSPELTIQGNVSISGIYAVDVSGAAIDQVLDIGQLNLAAGSMLSVSGVLSEASYVIMTYNTRLGSFADVSSVTGQGYDVIYDDIAGEVRLVLHGPPSVSIVHGTNGVTVFWPSFSGFTYWLEYRTNLLTGDWIPLGDYTNLPGIADILYATNFPTGPKSVFFQVLEE